MFGPHLSVRTWDDVSELTLVGMPGSNCAVSIMSSSCSCVSVQSDLLIVLRFCPRLSGLEPHVRGGEVRGQSVLFNMEPPHWPYCSVSRWQVRIHLRRTHRCAQGFESAGADRILLANLTKTL